MTAWDTALKVVNDNSSILRGSLTSDAVHALVCDIAEAVQSAEVAARQRIEELERALQEIEWCRSDEYARPECPFCRELQKSGHESGCIVAAALSSTPPTARPESTT